MSADQLNSGPAGDTIKEWFKAAPAEMFPEDGGMAVRYGNEQIAVFNYTSMGKWFATQNMCPHKLEMSLSRGIIGDAKGEPKVACPFHKRNFSLETGNCLSGDDMHIKVYPVKVEDGYVYIGIPAV